MQYRAWYKRTYLGQVFVSVTILAQGLDKAALATTGAPTLRVPRCHRAEKAAREGVKFVRGQAATFVTSCRRPRRGSEAVAADTLCTGHCAPKRQLDAACVHRSCREVLNIQFGY